MSAAGRVLAAVVWRPYYWIVYRRDQELQAFMIRRRIWGGERITPERRTQLAELRIQIADMFRDPS